MFSKKLILIVGLTLLIVVNVVILFIFSSRFPSHGIGRFALFLVAPIQDTVSETLQAGRDVWRHYFTLVATARENERLREELQKSIARNNQWQETALSNQRLRRLLDFKSSMSKESVAAEVIGRDPSPWYRTVIINKGRADGLRKALPVVVPEGVIGQVTDVSAGYAKVMLIVDRNSAVDALVQRSRARGVIKGAATSRCIFEYVLRKDEVAVGDEIITSGLDGVFPKGFPIGTVTGVIKRTSDIFQEVIVTPYSDFERLEEVLVVLVPPQPEFDSRP